MKRLVLYLFFGVILAACTAREDESAPPHEESVAAEQSAEIPAEAETPIVERDTQSTTDDTVSYDSSVTAESSAPDRPAEMALVADTRPAVTALAAQDSIRDRRRRAPDTRELRFEPLEPGLEFYEGYLRVGRRKLELKVVRVDLSSHRIGILAEHRRRFPGQSLIWFQKKYRAKVILSGGFLKSFNPALPLGLVRVDTVLLNRADENPLLNGVLEIRGDGRRVRIVPFRPQQDTVVAEDALQAGPLFLYHGEECVPDSLRRPDKQTRLEIGEPVPHTFIAIDTDRRVLLGLTSEITLLELAGLLKKPLGEGGLGCGAALNLSGPAHGALSVQAGSRSAFWGDVEQRLPNVIVIR